MIPELFAMAVGIAFVFCAVVSILIVIDEAYND